MGYVGLWRRGIAFIIDMFTIVLIAGVLTFAFGETISPGTTPDAIRNGMAFYNVHSSEARIMQIVFPWLYFAILESSPLQGTVGKRLMGAVVVDTQGFRIGFIRATVRYFSKWLSTAILLIGYLMIAFTKKKQGLHDVIAGTLVKNT